MKIVISQDSEKERNTDLKIIGAVSFALREIPKSQQANPLIEMFRESIQSAIKDDAECRARLGLAK